MAAKKTNKDNVMTPSTLLEMMANDTKLAKYTEMSDINEVGYKTGIKILDYALGKIKTVYNENDEPIHEYVSLGLASGKLALVIGGSSTYKTTTTIQMAYNIVKQFKSSEVHHIDVERSTAEDRPLHITKEKPSILAKKYKLIQSISTVAQLKEYIAAIYVTKMNNIDELSYNTGLKNIYGKEIILAEPTVVLVDSTSQFAVTDSEAFKDVKDGGGNTAGMRYAAEYTNFIREITPMCHKANIIFLGIGHISVKTQMGFAPEPAELAYLDQNEHIAGGKKQIYILNTLIKYKATTAKTNVYTMEEDGIDGGDVNAKIVKCRSNINGRQINIVVDKRNGYDNVRSLFKLALDNDLVVGNAAKYYLANDVDKEHPFKRFEMDKYFKQNRELYNKLIQLTDPILYSMLSPAVVINQEENEFRELELDY